MKTFRTAIAMLSMAVLVVGLAWPHLAARLLQMLIAGLAMGYVGFRVYRSGLPAALAGDAYTPFEARATRPPSASRAPAIVKLATLLGAVDVAESADRVAIPEVALRIVSAEGSRRLAEYRGLHVHDPTDRGRIRDIVSEATWAVLRRDTEPSKRHTYGDAIPLSRLESILDDLERL